MNNQSVTHPWMEGCSLMKGDGPRLMQQHTMDLKNTPCERSLVQEAEHRDSIYVKC